MVNSRISVITPCLNSAVYIEQTVLSVLNQSYENVEHIIIDGGSTDGTLDIIRQYENSIYYWLSEPDYGMYDAINKGIRQARGDIFAYINSDDFYYPGALEFVARYFQDHPEVDLLYGDLNFVDAENGVLFRQRYPDFDLSRFQSMKYATIGQPAAFWRRRLWEIVGEFDTSLKMASDFDFFIRAGQAGRLSHVPWVLAAFRVHEESMTQHQLEVSNDEVKELHQHF